MRTQNFLRIAALSLALAAPSFAGAHAGDIYDYSYEQDVWPQVQAARNVPQTVVDAATADRTDAGRAAPARGVYDQHDRYVDQRTGDLLPGAPRGGF